MNVRRVSDGILTFSPLVITCTAPPAAAPESAPIAAPLPPPAIAPMIAPSAVPPPITCPLLPVREALARLLFSGYVHHASVYLNGDHVERQFGFSADLTRLFIFGQLEKNIGIPRNNRPLTQHDRLIETRLEGLSDRIALRIDIVDQSDHDCSAGRYLSGRAGA